MGSGDPEVVSPDLNMEDFERRAQGAIHYVIGGLSWLMTVVV